MATSSLGSSSRDERGDIRRLGVRIHRFRDLLRARTGDEPQRAETLFRFVRPKVELDKSIT